LIFKSQLAFLGFGIAGCVNLSSTGFLQAIFSSLQELTPNDGPMANMKVG